MARVVLLASVAAHLAAAGSRAHGQVTPLTDLTGLTLEELGALDIAAASKRTQPLFETPAAVTVLLSEDVRRSGHGSVAEAMRLVPGVHVARQDMSNWSIGVRGFNGLSSTKLLVLVDGRTVYSPFYGGVSWAEAEIHLADLARIEVVRGPGATVWGANAVNGIVNIISRDAHETQGGLVSVRDGSAEPLDAYVRYGATLGGGESAFRVFGRITDSRNSIGPDAPAGVADVRHTRTGFRLDRHDGTESRLTVQGGFAVQRTMEINRDPAMPGRYRSEARYQRSFLLGRYERRFAPDNRLALQLYADYLDGSSRALNVGLGGGAAGGVSDNGNNLDLDLTHSVQVGRRNNLVWGGGLRRTTVDLQLDDTLAVEEPYTSYDVANMFAQDEIVLSPDRVHLTVGSKVERHEGSGTHVLPSVRMTWTPDHAQTWWASVSRAIRSPSRAELDTRVIYQYIPPTATTPPVRVELVADGTMREEILDAIELGWRLRASSHLTFEATAYRNDYSQLRNLSPRFVFQPDPPLVINELVIVGDLEATGTGIELSADWRINDNWRMTADYSHQKLEPEGGIGSPLIELDLALPRDLWGLQSWWQLPQEFEFSLGLSGASGLPAFGVDGYTRVDALLTWRPRLDLEAGIGVQNALEEEHFEYLMNAGFRTAGIRRNVYGRVSWRF